MVTSDVTLDLFPNDTFRPRLTKFARAFGPLGQLLSVAMQSSRWRENRKTRTNKKKAEDFSSASFRLVPSPRYFANLKTLLQRGNRIDAGRTGQRRRARTHYSILERAEVADASLVRNQRVCRRLVTRVQSAGRSNSHGEGIASLFSSRQIRVKQASASRGGRSAGRARQSGQQGKAHRRVGGV